MTQSSPTTSDILTDAFAPVEVLPVQAGDYAYLAWLDQERLVVQYDQAHINNFSAAQLGVVTRTSTSVEPLNAPPHPACEAHLFSTGLPTSTPTGQLAYISRCIPHLPDGYLDYPMLYDPKTNTAMPARSQPFNPLTPQNNPTGVDDYSFFSDVQTGLLVDRATGQNHLHSFDATSVTKVDLGFTRVSHAVLAPNGQQFLMAAQDGSPGIHLLDQPSTIFLATPHTWERRDLFSAYQVHSSTWSPDSRYVAVMASEVNDGISDLWLIDAETGTRRRIAHGNYGGMAWSPDGTTLAVFRYIHGINTLPIDTRVEIVLLDLTAIELP